MGKIAKNIILLFLILFIAATLRFYNLGSIPAGLHGDAASQGYNAFSLLSSGRDRYGEQFPLLFRSLGSYQPSVYTYLTTVPVFIFGNTPFSARFISALSGVVLVLVTFLLFLTAFDFKGKVILALTGAALVAVAPWSVFFSRLAVEANLALAIFASSILLFWRSLKKPYLFVVASFFLGVSTHTYYSERLVAVLFLPLFVLIFKGIWLHQKRWLIFGLMAFAITQIPHISVISSGAYTRRFNQVSNAENYSLKQTLTDNYLVYYSIPNLFFDSDSNLGRAMPGLSVFYSWMIVPLIFGIRELVSGKIARDFAKILGLLAVITPIPAGLTGDLFYPLRVLDFLWVLTLIVAIGMYTLYTFLKANIARVGLVAALALYSIFSLYISYFILFKYEKAENYGFAYLKLMDQLSQYRGKEVIIDSARDSGIGVRMAYLTRFDPGKLQEQLRPQMKTSYYNSFVNNDEVYVLENIIVKPIKWGEACKKDVVFVGDPLALSEKEVKEHKLKFEFEILDLSGKIALLGYKTAPEEKCPSLSAKDM